MPRPERRRTMKKRAIVCLLLCALLCSCRATEEVTPNGFDTSPNTQSPTDTDEDTLLRIAYYEQLVNDLQKEILALRTEIYVGRVEYEALLEDLLSQTPPVVEEDDTQNTDFFYVVENGKATVTSYVGTAIQVTVPQTIDGYEVVAIGDRAFMDRNDVVSVTVPTGVCRVGWFAFSGCVALKNVVLPDSVDSISYGAFENCAPTLTIRCSQNSYAAAYAGSYGIATAR